MRSAGLGYAKYGLSEVNFGHIPGGLVSRVLCEYLPKRQALYYSITGDADERRRSGGLRARQSAKTGMHDDFT